MNFELDAQQRQIQQAVRALVAEHVTPFARGWDTEERFPSEAIGPLA